jgi:hypothetical protein
VDVKTEELTKFLNVRKVSSAGKLKKSPNFILKKLVLIKVDNVVFFSHFPNRIKVVKKYRFHIAAVCF